MKHIAKLIKVLLMMSGIFFIVTFTVYMFNLDMKLTAALQPFIQDLQEKAKRDRHL